MWGICIKQSKRYSNDEWFLEIGKVYEILSEDKIGYYLEGYGWITKDLLSIQEFRESQITEILNDTSLEM